MTKNHRQVRFGVQRPWALATVAVLASAPHLLTGQTLRPLGPPARVPAADGALVQSKVDGTWEAAQPMPGGFPSFDQHIAITHFSSTLQAGPAFDPSEETGGASSQFQPALAALQNGGYVVVWQNATPIYIFSSIFSLRPPAGSSARPAAAGDNSTLSARVLDNSGQPVGGEIQVTPSNATASSYIVAALSSGGFVVSWLQSPPPMANGPAPTLMAMAFDAAGVPVTGPVAIATGVDRNIGLAALGDGGFVAAWGGQGILWQRFNAAGSAVLPAVRAVDVDAGGLAELAANPTGQVAMAWMTTDTFQQPLSSVMAEVYNQDGAAQGAPSTVATWTDNGFTVVPLLGGLAVNLAGQTLVSWSQRRLIDGDSTAFAQVFDPTGTSLGPPVPTGSFLGSTVADNGTWNFFSNDGNDAFEQQWSTAGCSPSPSSLCLDADRFRLDAKFTHPATGSVDVGTPEQIADGSGALWFFDPSTPELVAKVIDGTAVNGHFWVFFASLTDVEFDLTVTDTRTGASRVYHNAAGTLASQADTGFPLQASPSRAAAAEVDAAAAPVANAAVPANAAARPASAAASSAMAHWAALPAPDVAAARAAGVEPVCNSTDRQLCLLGSEFTVTVSTNGGVAPGQAVQLSGAGGYYWFFGPANAELAVKVLDGRAINGHIWVFYASLTDVEFDLTVTDNFSPTHASRTYHNAAGNLASAADVTAF